MSEPVFAIPFLAGDLRSCIESIDRPVRLITIDNSPTGETWDIVPDDAHVIDMPTNIGYTASVNLAIRSTPREPFWIIANHDIVLAPGDLDRLIAATADHGWVGINDWAVFAITAECVERVGFWDENFYNYVSDADFERRCDLAGVRRGFITGETRHASSAVINENPGYARANRRSYPQEVAYYCAKWGVSAVRADGGFPVPFDGAVASSDGPDLSRLRALAWD